MVALILVVPTLADAKGLIKKRPAREDWITMSGFYSQYVGLNTSPNTPTARKPAPSADMELAIRLLPTLSLVGSLSNSLEPERGTVDTNPYRIRTSGGGLKLDLPRFFLYGSTKKDFRASAKTWPIHTFILAEGLSLEMRDMTLLRSEYVMAGRYGVGVDIFPASYYAHFTLRALYLNFSNEGHIVYGLGGGITY